MFIAAEQPTSNIMKIEGNMFTVKHFWLISSYLVTMLINDIVNTMKPLTQCNYFTMDNLTRQLKTM